MGSLSHYQIYGPQFVEIQAIGLMTIIPLNRNGIGLLVNSTDFTTLKRHGRLDDIANLQTQDGHVFQGFEDHGSR